MMGPKRKIPVELVKDLRAIGLKFREISRVIYLASDCASLPFDPWSIQAALYRSRINVPPVDIHT